MNLKFCRYLFCLFPLWIHAEINWEDLTEKIYLTPEVFHLTAVGEGATNANFILELDEGHYFIRIAPEEAEWLGASIEVEYEVLQALKDLHVSPQALYFNQNRKILVTEFMQSAVEAVLFDPGTRLKVFSLLHKIEASQVTISRMYEPYRQVIELIQLAKSLKIPVPEIYDSEILPALKKIDQVIQNQEKVLSHFDLHHANIIKNEAKMWIVDWEYAVMSNRFLTLASMTSTEFWDDDQMKSALDEYLPNYTDQDYQTLFLSRIVIDIHWAAWCHIQASLSTLDRPYEAWKDRYLSEALKRIRLLNQAFSELSHP